MTPTYEEYVKACTRIRQQNAGLLSDFGDWLAHRGLSAQTIRMHVQNCDLYINTYLLYEDAIEAKDGAYQVGMFLGYWFIRKAAWSSVPSIRRQASSLKKFYTFLHEQGFVQEEAVQQVRETIKERMPEWLATMRRYEDPAITDPAVIWGL